MAGAEVEVSAAPAALELVIDRENLAVRRLLQVCVPAARRIASADSSRTVHFLRKIDYDALAYRIVKIDQIGKPILSLRDENGNARSEYLVENGLTNPRLDKDFIYLNRQSLIERMAASCATSDGRCALLER